MAFPASLPASIAGLQQARSAAALKNLQSPSNINSFDDIYSVDPHASAAAMLSSNANAGRATDALVNLGGGPERLGLINAMGDARLAHANDETDQLADLNSGVPQAIAGKRLAEQNTLADTASEAAAGRQLLPNASAVNQRSTAAQMQELYTRYVEPELLKGQAMRDVESGKNAGAAALATQKNDPNALRLRALLDTLTSIMGKKGKALDPTTVQGMSTAFGVK